MIFIDGSNLYHVLEEVCGRHDIDFQKFAHKLAESRQVVRTYYYNAITERDGVRATGFGEHERFIHSLHQVPYLEVKLGVAKIRGDGEIHEKGVDVMIATDIVVYALRDNYDTVVLVSGDADFYPALQAAKDAGKKVEIAAFSQNISPEAARVADVSVALNKTYFRGLWNTVRKSTSQRSGMTVSAKTPPLPMMQNAVGRAPLSPARDANGQDAILIHPKVSARPSDKSSNVSNRESNNNVGGRRAVGRTRASDDDVSSSGGRGSLRSSRVESSSSDETSEDNVGGRRVVGRTERSLMMMGLLPEAEVPLRSSRIESSSSEETSEDNVGESPCCRSNEIFC